MTFAELATVNAEAAALRGLRDYDAAIQKCLDALDSADATDPELQPGIDAVKTELMKSYGEKGDLTNAKAVAKQLDPALPSVRKVLDA